MKALPTAAAAARILAGLVLLAAGFQKAVAPPQEFAAVMDAYQLLPEAWLVPAAQLLAWAQVLAGAALAAGYLTRLSAAAAGSLYGLFWLVLASVKLRGIPLEDCGCFGPSIQLSPLQTLGIDTVLIALAWLAWRDGGRLVSLDSWIEAGVP